MRGRGLREHPPAQPDEDVTASERFCGSEGTRVKTGSQRSRSGAPKEASSTEFPILQLLLALSALEGNLKENYLQRTDLRFRSRNVLGSGERISEGERVCGVCVCGTSKVSENLAGVIQERWESEGIALVSRSAPLNEVSDVEP